MNADNCATACAIDTSGDRFDDAGRLHGGQHHEGSQQWDSDLEGKDADLGR
jgi:hypothetical protein